jgi:putative FmdB family regulatory protein
MGVPGIMPIYEYRCDKCRVTVEKYQYEAKVPNCAHCGDETHKLISVTASRPDMTMYENGYKDAFKGLKTNTG